MSAAQDNALVLDATANNATAIANANNTSQLHYIAANAHAAANAAWTVVGGSVSAAIHAVAISAHAGTAAALKAAGK